MKEKIIKKSKTEIKFITQYYPTFTILNILNPEHFQCEIELLGEKAKKVIKKVGVFCEIQNVLGTLNYTPPKSRTGEDLALDITGRFIIQALNYVAKFAAEAIQWIKKKHSMDIYMQELRSVYILYFFLRMTF